MPIMTLGNATAIQRAVDSQGNLIQAIDTLEINGTRTRVYEAREISAGSGEPANGITLLGHDTWVSGGIRWHMFEFDITQDVDVMWFYYYFGCEMSGNVRYEFNFDSGGVQDGPDGLSVDVFSGYNTIRLQYRSSSTTLYTWHIEGTQV